VSSSETNATWTSFVEGLIEPVEEDAYVRHVKDAVARGATIRKVTFVRGASTSGRQEYIVLLEEHERLSTFQLPHSAGFTAWSLAAGIRMESPTNEAERFAVLLAEGVETMDREYGRDLTTDVITDQIRRLGPPRTTHKLGDQGGLARSSGPAGRRAKRDLRAIFALPASQLVTLGYSKSSIADILDEALALYIDSRLMLTEGPRIWGR